MTFRAPNFTSPSFYAVTWYQSWEVSFNQRLNPSQDSHLPGNSRCYTDQVWSFHRPDLTAYREWQQTNVRYIGKDVLPNRILQVLPAPEFREFRTWEWRQVDKLGKDVLPFRDDHSLPPQEFRLYKSWEWTNVLYIGKDTLPFRIPTGIDSREFREYRDWYQRFQLTPPAVVSNPFYQTDWPLTADIRAYREWTWRQVDKIGLDVLPFLNPTGIESREFREFRDWYQRFQLTPPPVVTNPFYQLDWPLTPDNRAYRDYSWRQVGYLGFDVLPFGRASNEVPRDPRDYREWQWRQVDKIGFDVLPFNQKDWPNPILALVPSANNIDPVNPSNIPTAIVYILMPQILT